MWYVHRRLFISQHAALQSHNRRRGVARFATAPYLPISTSMTGSKFEMINCTSKWKVEKCVDCAQYLLAREKAFARKAATSVACSGSSYKVKLFAHMSCRSVKSKKCMPKRLLLPLAWPHLSQPRPPKDQTHSPSKMPSLLRPEECTMSASLTTPL